MPIRPSGRSLLVAAPLALTLAACADEPTSPSLAPSSAPQLGLSSALSGVGRYLVQFRETAPANLSAATLAAAGGSVVDRVDHLNTLVVDKVRNAAALAKEPGVVAVERSLTFNALPVANRTTLSPSAVGGASAHVGASGTNQSNALFFAANAQWGLKAIHANTAWTSSKGGAGVNVCIIDSGISEAHPELAGKVVARTSFVPNDPKDPSKGFSAPQLDSVFHGTHVASTVTSNGINIASVAPDAKLMTAKVFAATGGTSDATIIKAVKWCADNGAGVINMSLGGFTSRSDFTTLNILQAGLDYATSRGVLIVAAAGNENFQIPNPVYLSTPAEMGGVLNVGATGPVTKAPAKPLSTNPAANRWDPFDPTQVWQGVDGRAFYSEFGTGVDVFAPGGVGSLPLSFVPRGQSASQDNVLAACSVEVCGLASGPQYVFAAGTSMASPHAAGVAALVRAELTPDASRNMALRITNCIKATTDDIGPSTTFGGGRVNAQAAVDRAKAGLC